MKNIAAMLLLKSKGTKGWLRRKSVVGGKDQWSRLGCFGWHSRGAVESSWVWSLWNSFCLAQLSVALSWSSTMAIILSQDSISEPNKKKHIFFSLLISSIIHMARGHDQPNPALIIEGSRRPQPSKRVQGRDYPVFASEELQKRDKGTY